MSEAPLAPNCRHCGATNDSVASECWQCERRDWRETPKIPSRHSPFRSLSQARSTFTGCMVVIFTMLCTVVGLAFRAGQVVDWSSCLRAVIFTLAIALFTICMAFE